MSFPKYLFLGRSSRRSCRSVDVSSVKAAGDLPERMFLGDLSPETFVRKGSDWSVRYVDSAPDTWSAVKYESGSLSVHECFHGVSGGFGITGSDELSELLIAHSSQPLVWDAVLRDRLEPAFNLSVPSVGDGSMCISFFPDGYQEVVMCPVPFSKLLDTTELVGRIDADPEVRAVATVELMLGTDTIAYFLDRCPDIPNDPLAIYLHVLDETGFPPLGMPQADPDAPDDVIQLDRVRYSLVVTCAYRDLERVVRHIADAGFIEEIRPDEQAVNKPEWQALLGPSGFDVFVMDVPIPLWDRSQPPSRVVQWHGAADPEAAQAKLEQLKEEPNLEKLAERTAAQIPEVAQLAAALCARAREETLESDRERRLVAGDRRRKAQLLAAVLPGSATPRSPRLP